MGQHDLLDLLQTCDDAGLAVGPIYSAEEILKDPHIKARGSIITRHDPETGKDVRMASPSGRFSGFKGEVRTLGPTVGQHTDSVLSGLLHYSPEQLEALRKRGVIN